MLSILSKLEERLSLNLYDCMLDIDMVDFCHFSLKNFYPKFLVTQNSINKDLEIYFSLNLKKLS